MKIRESQQEKIFSQVTSIILRARGRAKATEALAQDLKNMDSDSNRKEVKTHEQASISY